MPYLEILLPWDPGAIEAVRSRRSQLRMGKKPRDGISGEPSAPALAFLLWKSRAIPPMKSPLILTALCLTVKTCKLDLFCDIAEGCRVFVQRPGFEEGGYRTFDGSDYLMRGI